jgi:hypothetical protein
VFDQFLADSRQDISKQVIVQMKRHFAAFITCANDPKENFVGTNVPIGC